MRKSFLFIILLCVCLPGLIGCKAPNTIPPIPTATVVQRTSTPTSLPTATFTPTPNTSVAGGGLLTAAQKKRLADAASSYIADTETDAIRVANSLHYLDTAAHPASMCGPLAIAILQDAGLLDPAIDRHDFWQLDPRPTQGLPTLEHTFPRENYEWITVTTSLDKVDFKAFPLYPGDFLYLYAGSNGSFEHMLVVSRVDAEGRAYSVTNIRTSTGYIIQEVMLYDPNQPGVGMFYDWTNLAYNSIGNTGFGGFDLWRPSTPIQDPTPAIAAFRHSIDALIPTLGGQWNIYFARIGGPVYLERLVNEPIHPASTIKVPIAMLFLKTLDDMGVSDLTGYLSSHVIADRPMDQLLRFMLVYSEEDATNLITDWLEGEINYRNLLAVWGATSTSLSPRSTTLHDLALLYQSLYLGEGLSATARQTILDLLAEYTSNDDTRLGSLRSLLGENAIVCNKRGTITTERLIVADSAIVEYEGNAYLILIFAQPKAGQVGPTYEQLEDDFTELTQKIAAFLRSSIRP